MFKMALCRCMRIGAMNYASLIFRRIVLNDIIGGASKNTKNIVHFNHLLITRECQTSAAHNYDLTLHAHKIGILSSNSSRIKTISKSMKAYLQRAIQHENFIKDKRDEFEIGKRHLANMMGVDVVNLTQAEIDKAVEYLFPSGLYDKKARPKMKPPEEMYPKQKASQYDISGRPFSCFFYTARGNFYEILHDIVENFKELDAFEDKMLRRGITEPPEESKLFLSGSEWFDIKTLQSVVLEKLTEKEYNLFIETLNRLSIHPYSFRCKEVIFKYRKIFPDAGTLDVVPNLSIDDGGTPFITAESKRKTAAAKVTVRKNGKGIIRINDMNICYFKNLQDREQILFPLHFTELLGSVDVEATVEGGGSSCQAGAIRHTLSLALRSFVTPELVEKMRLVGLLSKDKRRRERKKPGQKGARAKYTWLKR